MQLGVDYEKPASQGWIVAGYIFGLLGGLIGIAIGAWLMTGKVKMTDGTKVFKFDESGRKQGKIILVIAVIFLITWNILARM